jgi:ABC-type antimicrobial peptide transport system permease subunit
MPADDERAQLPLPSTPVVRTLDIPAEFLFGDLKPHSAGRAIVSHEARAHHAWYERLREAARLVQLGRIITSILYGVSPHDPIAITIAVAVPLGAATLAAALPTRRATRLDPATVLRAD